MSEQILQDLVAQVKVRAQMHGLDLEQIAAALTPTKGGKGEVKKKKVKEKGGGKKMKRERIKRDVERARKLAKDLIQKFENGEEIVVDWDTALHLVEKVYERTGTFEHWMSLLSTRRQYVVHSCIGGVLTEIITGKPQFKYLTTEDNGGDDITFKIGKKIPEIKKGARKKTRKTKKKTEEKISLEKAKLQLAQANDLLIQKAFSTPPSEKEEVEEVSEDEILDLINDTK
jgi:hypothetical protein